MIFQVVDLVLQFPDHVVPPLLHMELCLEFDRGSRATIEQLVPFHLIIRIQNVAVGAHQILVAAFGQELLVDIGGLYCRHHHLESFKLFVLVLCWLPRGALCLLRGSVPRPLWTESLLVEYGVLFCPLTFIELLVFLNSVPFLEKRDHLQFVR